MKTYEESIKYIVDGLTIGNMMFRYVKWAPAMMVAEIYGFTTDQVFIDINAGVEKFNKDEKLKMKKNIHEPKMRRGGSLI